MAHTMKSMKSMGKSIAKGAKQFGHVFERADAKPAAPESRVEKTRRLAREAMDKVEIAVHEAKDAKTDKEMRKKMAVAQTHLTAAHKACNAKE